MFSLYCAVSQRSQQNLDDIFTLIIDKMYICIHVLIRHGGQSLEKQMIPLQETVNSYRRRQIGINLTEFRNPFCFKFDYHCST